MTTDAVIEPVIIALLRADARIAERTGGRIATQFEGQGEPRPYVIVERIDTTDWWDLDGPTGLESPRLQVEVFADTPAEAKELAALVYDALTAVRQVTTGGVLIQHIRRVDERDGFELVEGTESGPRSVQQDYIVHYARD